jgi:ribonuclease-3
MFDFFRSLFSKKTSERKPESTLDEASRRKIEFLENLLGFRVGQPALYLRALRHRSRLGDARLERSDSYERLEFLGDAVLDLSTTELLFERFPKEDEGALTKYRAMLVKGDALARYAQAMNLSAIVEVGKRARNQNVQHSENVLADVFESLIGAIFKDKGYEAARAFAQGVIVKMVDFSELKEAQDNWKSVLLEFSQSRRMQQPEYVILSEEGPDHEKTFEIEVRLNGEAFGKGSGKSKKRAEQIAARSALEALGVHF